MKHLPTLFLAAFVVLLSTGFAAQAADATAAKKAPQNYDTYTCDELTDLAYERVGSVVYYIRGHYDAKHDIWAGYEPSKQKKIEDDFYVPVETIYDYCMKNKSSTVVDAIAKSGKK